jgi:hypothetical protein
MEPKLPIELKQPATVPTEASDEADDMQSEANWVD